MAFSAKNQKQAGDAVNKPPKPPNLRTWSQVVSNQRTSLMHRQPTTTIDNSGTTVTHSQVWRLGRSPGSVFLDMTIRPESPVELMTIIPLVLEC
jgi:hypothetical protein